QPGGDFCRLFEHGRLGLSAGERAHGGHHAMNSRALVHLAWKDYRAIRSFWVALVLFTIVMQWLTWTLAEPGASVVESMWWWALMIPGLFALGCAGTTFAVEREEGTLEFLHSAPIAALEIFASKLGVALAMTAAMYASLALVSLMWTQAAVPKLLPV